MIKIVDTCDVITVIKKKSDNNSGKWRLKRPNFKRPEVIGSNFFSRFKELA